MLVIDQLGIRFAAWIIRSRQQNLPAITGLKQRAEAARWLCRETPQTGAKMPCLQKGVLWLESPSSILL
jgi:hypothetical protein